MSTDPTEKLCECGCGQPAGVYTKTATARGFRKGASRRYILGHNPGPPRRNPASVEERFFAKVQVEGPDECWPWVGAHSRGYGRFMVDDRMVVATHWSYEHFVGPVPAGLFVCHRCDNGACVNPAHLFVGDQKANLADMVAKGRSARGEGHSHAKLTEDDVREIRERGLGVRGAATYLAAEFGVTPTNIYYILRGETWKHVA